MKLQTRIFLSFFIIFGGGFYYLADEVMEDLRVRYLEGVEEALVDQAHLLAEWISQSMEAETFDSERLHRIFQKTYERTFEAKIYKLVKTHVDLRVYITDSSGWVVFDSEHQDEGADYSQWRDVFLTLKGEYGARATLLDPEDPDTTILYIAAPIRVQNETVGVLTVAKPTTNIRTFLKAAKNQVLQVTIISGIAVLLLSLIMTYWVTRPIQLLTRYAKVIRRGNQATLPKLDQSEVGELGRSFESMREALEGKQYVEQYIQSLTHELKSPLSSIRGAAELLTEDMPASQRTRFLENIHSETMRMQQIVDRLLQLSALENRHSLQTVQDLDLQALISKVVIRLEPKASQKNIQLNVQIGPPQWFRGDEFLLQEALINLLENAIDFSPVHEVVDIKIHTSSAEIRLTIEDKGPGIPEFALDRVFEKFFSLPRPNTQKKSTGLGLNFVQEIAKLHGGMIRLESRSPQGVEAILCLPVNSKPTLP